MKIILPKNLIHDGEYHEEDAIQSVIFFVNCMLEGFYTFDELPDVCKEIYYIDYYICQIENGGLAQFVWNSGWEKDIRKYVRNGLKNINAKKHLKLFQKFENEVDSLKDELNEFLKNNFCSEESVKEKINTRTQEFYNLDESIQTLSSQFIKSCSEFLHLKGDELQRELQKIIDANPNATKRKAANEAKIKEAAQRSPLIALGKLIADKANLEIDTNDPYAVKPYRQERLTSKIDFFLHSLSAKDRKYHLFIFEKDATLFYEADDINHFVTEVTVPPEIGMELFKNYNDKETQANPIDWCAALSTGNIAKMKRILDAGFEINTILGELNENALLLSAIKGQLEVFKFLIENGADINSKDYFGSGALMLAAEHSKVNIILYLQELGQDITQTNEKGRGIIHFLAKNEGIDKYLDCIMKLITAGAPISTDQSNESPLHIALENGNFKLAKKLIESGTNLITKGTNQNNYLNYLSFIKKSPQEIHEMAKLLIEKGARPEAGESDPIISCDTSCIKLFLKHGSDINSFNGQSALHNAVSDSDLERIKILIELGADHSAVMMDWSEDKKKTCLDIIESDINRRTWKNSKKEEVRDFLISIGAKRFREL